MKKRIFQITFILLILVIAYIRLTSEKYRIKETRVALGTFVTIEVKDRNSNNKSFVDSAFALIDRYEKQLSLSKPNSEINKINKSAKKEIPISNEIFQLIQKSNQISELSDGAFDITIGTILKEYDFINKKVPSATQIYQKIGLVNYKKLKTENNILIKENSNIYIDLGGIAKGFIIDKVIEYLRNHGIENASVDAGGDLFVMKNDKNEYWKIGIQHPRNNGEIFGHLKLKDLAIVTSGDYERYFFNDEKRIHHILDPKTGLPADKSICVTIITEDAIIADALCTAIFVMGPQKGIELANNLKNVEAIIIYEKNGNLKYKESDGLNKFGFQRTNIKSNIQ